MRKEKKLTQQQVAEEIGISRQAYANYETGSREPDMKTLITLANFYKVPIALFYGFTEEKNQKEQKNMTFYEKLRELCNQHGTSVTAVAKKIGLSGSVVTTWKNSKGLPRAGTVKKIAEHFSVPVNYFYSRDFDINPRNNGIIQNTHAPATVINESENKFSEQELVLLEIFAKLDIIGKAQLLAYAAELRKDFLN